jgi:hypothetical protein
MHKLLLTIAFSLFALGTVSAQKFEFKDGKVVSVPAITKKAKKADKVYATVDGVTFYQGSRGGIYYLKPNGKKAYVKKTK